MENVKTQNSGISGSHGLPYQINKKEMPFEKLYTELTKVKYDLDDLSQRVRHLEAENNAGNVGKKKYNNKLEKLSMGMGSVGVRHQDLLTYPMSGYEVEEMTKLSVINREIMGLLTKLTKELGV